MRMNAHTEAPFTVDKARQVIWRQSIQLRPSLLMIRTRRIVTDHLTTLLLTCDTIGTAGYSDFPANSRVL